jgi:hypothetical protein
VRTLKDDSCSKAACRKQAGRCAHHDHQAGVHSLAREIGAVVRYKAVGWAKHIDVLEDRVLGVGICIGGGDEG